MWRAARKKAVSTCSVRRNVSPAQRGSGKWTRNPAKPRKGLLFPKPSGTQGLHQRTAVDELMDGAAHRIDAAHPRARQA